jgi:serine protease Do
MVARVSPAVVRVVTVRPLTTAVASVQSSGKAGVSAASPGTSTTHGSGYIIDPSGYVGTNRHVVEGGISVFVVTADGVRYPATVVGMPDGADIALLKIDPGREQLPFVTFGDSEKVRVGQRAVAIGSPFGFDNTVTSGIISALNRDLMEGPYDDYLQTDAAINHGNSGGPLFNMAGEVIGMNSVIYSPDPGFSGVAFALPSSCLKFVFGRLMKTGRIGASMLAIHTQQVSWMLAQAFGLPDLHGAIVTAARDDAGAMPRGKLMVGDVIRTFNGMDVLDPRDLARKAVQAPVGSDAVLGIYRGAQVESVHVTMQALPEAAPIVLNNDWPPTIGLELASRHEENGAQLVTVAAVDPVGTAADSGIQKGDIIVRVQDTKVTEPDQALRAFQARSSQRQRFAAVLVERDDKRFWLSLAIPE